MNEAEARGAFKEALDRLVTSATRSMREGAADAYIPEPDGTVVVQEATTRAQFLDDLLDALGWSRGRNGDLGEEVRLRGETTVFVDYLGTARLLAPGQATPVPLLLVEAKAWGKPFIGPRLASTALSIDDLLMAGIKHVRQGGAASKSVLRTDWHDHLEQIATYVRRLFDHHQHKVRRVLLTSGDWLLILDDAYEAFLGAGLGDDQFTFMKIDAYVRRSDLLYTKLSKAHLGQEMPDWVTVARAPAYLAGAEIARAFLAAQVTHIRVGSRRVGQIPVITIVPHVILLDAAGRQLSVFSGDRESLQLTGRDIGVHLDLSRAMAIAVLAACSDVYGLPLSASALTDFPGLPRAWRDDPNTPNPFVRAVLTEAAEWTVVTGEDSHFLLAQPRMADCAFHRWDGARSAGSPAGNAAVNMPEADGPRTLFVDGDHHHCAHAGLLARREKRCRIKVFEQRMCCQACRFFEGCWTPQERAELPCGAILNAPPPNPALLDEF